MGETTQNWKRAAEEMAARVPRSSFEPSVLRELESRESAAANWAIGFSGGADSLAALLLTWAHWPEKRALLRALHFNHCLRGAASDGDETFCREVAEALGIGFRAGRWLDVPKEPNEAACREARGDFFREALAMEDARLLITGHHLDDVAETMLMRLARGSGTAGLAAPRPVRRRPEGTLVVSPLLEISKAAIIEGLRAVGVSWREDASNATDLYYRNRIRQTVVPAWRAAASNDALAGAALSRRRLQEDDEAVESWLAQLGVAVRDDQVDFSRLRGLPAALWRRQLWQWPKSATLSREGFEELLEICQSGSGQCSVAGGHAVVSGFVLTWRGPAVPRTVWECSRLQMGGGLVLPSGDCVQANEVELTETLKREIFARRVDRSSTAYLSGTYSALVVRNWRSGDAFRPLGAPGTATLQDIFVNQKLPAEERGRVPVICDENGNILWVPGFSPADHSKVTEHSIAGVQLTYHRGTSTVTP